MNRKELVRKLELVGPALATTNLVPIFTNYVFHEDLVSAYNDEIGIVTDCDMAGAAFGVSGTVLLGLLQNTEVEDVNLTVEKENVVVIAGKSTFKLPYAEENEFLFHAPDEKWSIKLKLDEDLLKGIGICLTTACRDNTMPAIMGVCFKAGALYSCDGDAITRYKADIKGQGSHTVSNAFCDALIKICGETDTTEGLLEIGATWAKARLTNGYTIYGRMIENVDFDHETQIKNTLGGKETFVEMPMGFNEALGRARVLADPESAKTVLQVAKGKLKMQTNTHMGVAKEELTMRGHLDVEAAIHASLVQRSLAICNQVTILPNATAYRLGEKVLQVVSNIGE